MYNIKQFKPTLFILLFLGMTGYALASQAPAVWILGGGGVLLNAWLAATGRFRPMSRLLANLVTIGAFLLVISRVRGAGQALVLVIGQFLVLLQLVKLWEQRANRDYAQLIVLSLLLMVAASISTASLLFAVILVAYLFLSLYCCLLFHLKVETDAAKEALALPEEKLSPDVLRQDQRYLSRSMRRLTGVVSFASIVMAVVVFLFFPRGAGQNFLSPVQFRAAQTLTGFSDEVNLDQVAAITKNEAIVAYVGLEHDGQKVTNGETLLLRGVSLDTYNPAIGKGQWTRTVRDAFPVSTVAREPPARVGNPGGEEHWRQKINLQPTGTRTLFALAGPQTFVGNRDVRVRVGQDGALQSEDPFMAPIEYVVTSSGRIEDVAGAAAFPAPPPTIDPRIDEYARRPEVSGADERGPLAAQRAAAGPLDRLTAEGSRPHPLDGLIAENIERHLKGAAFRYTLDITDAKTRKGVDPYVWFLSDDGKRGHCEYFAGAMALMCQSLGMRARVVVGFKSDEFNAVGGYYIVRQSHAHAWVEVLTTDGWRTFDPTTGREGPEVARAGGWLQGVKHFFNFLEFTYAQHVVAYDNENRDSIIQSVEQQMTRPIYRTLNSSALNDFFEMPWVRKSMGSIVGLGIMSVGTAIVVVGLWALWQQIKLRRRAARIGIRSLPVNEQVRLARQLGFYDDLLRLLDRYRIQRPAHLTPLEFSRSLFFLPSDIYDSVYRLTGIFYRVRFGDAELGVGQQRRLAAILSRVEAELAEAMPAPK